MMPALIKVNAPALPRADAVDHGEQLTEVTERDRLIARRLARIQSVEHLFSRFYVAVIAAVVVLIAVPVIGAIVRGTRP